MGIDVTPKRFTDQTILRQLDVVTPISNLYMTGQDTVLCGVTLCQVCNLCVIAIYMCGRKTTTSFFSFYFSSSSSPSPFTHLLAYIIIQMFFLNSLILLICIKLIITIKIIIITLCLFHSSRV